VEGCVFGLDKRHSSNGQGHRPRRPSCALSGRLASLKPHQDKLHFLGDHFDEDPDCYLNEVSEDIVIPSDDRLSAQEVPEDSSLSSDNTATPHCTAPDTHLGLAQQMPKLCSMHPTVVFQTMDAAVPVNPLSKESFPCEGLGCEETKVRVQSAGIRDAACHSTNSGTKSDFEGIAGKQRACTEVKTNVPKACRGNDSNDQRLVFLPSTVDACTKEDKTGLKACRPSQVSVSAFLNLRGSACHAHPAKAMSLEYLLAAVLG
jgi:hypothetical protein